MGQDVKGQFTFKVTNQNGEHDMVCEPYSGLLVVEAHAVREHDPTDPWWADNITRALDDFMRKNGLSRLEAYWNAVPPEET